MGTYPVAAYGYGTAATSVSDQANLGLPLADLSGSVTRAVRKWQQLWAGLSATLPTSLEAANQVSSSTVTHASARASAFDLTLYAEQRLARGQANGDASPSVEALRGLRRVLHSYVSDDGPTPQVGFTQSGSVELQWLAGGTLVAALFDHFGDYNLCAMDAESRVIFDADIEYGATPPVEIEEQMRGLLENMKLQVRVRPTDF